VKVTASDGSLTASDTFTLTITPVNDAPVAHDDGPVATPYNVTKVFTTASLLGNDTDVDSAVLALAGVGTATHGSVMILADGSVGFTPDADYRGAASFTYDISDGAGGTASAVVALDIQGIAGRTITGTAANNTLTGTAFDDVIYGLAGHDRLNGNGGVDRLVGGAGNDTYIVDSVGDTTVELAGEGSDLVQSSISWTLGANFEKLMLTGTANINGAGNDVANTITGNAGNNIISGGGGADVLRGSGGDDQLSGDAGNDRLEGSAGTDTLFGGDGIDTVEFTLASGGVTVNLATGMGTAGDAAGDSYASIEYVAGSAYADDLTGDAFANRLSGNAGDDVLDGGDGRDVLVGGLGQDWMTGGAGADVFQINIGSGQDVITDFWAGAGHTDRVQFTGGQFVSFADVVSHSANAAAGVLITINADDSLTLAGVAISQLRADDFLFL